MRIIKEWKETKMTLGFGIGFGVAALVPVILIVFIPYPVMLFVSLLPGTFAVVTLSAGVSEVRTRAKYSAIYSGSELMNLKSTLTLTEKEIIDVTPGRRFKAEKLRQKNPFLQITDDTVICSLSCINRFEICPSNDFYEIRINGKYKFPLEAKELSVFLPLVYRLDLPSITFRPYAPVGFVVFGITLIVTLIIIFLLGLDGKLGV